MRWPRLPWARSPRREGGRHAATPVRRTASWAPAATPPAKEHVLLGFADGSEVELGADHPAALALRAVADLLLRTESA